MGSKKGRGGNKDAEEALRRLEQEKGVILDGILELIVYQDTNSKVLWTNEAAGESVGLAPEQLVGRHCYEIWQQRSEPCAGCPVVKSRKTGRPQKAEMTTPDGRVWFVRGYPIRGANGKLIGAVELTLEITERKKAEENLRESEERYRNVIEGAYDMIQSVKPDGTFDFVNRAWLETMGYTEAELPSLNLFDIIHPDSLSHCQEIFSQVIAGNAVSDVQATFVAKDGRSVFVHGSAAPRHLEGKLIATHGFFCDITERKKAEEELQKAAEEWENTFDSISDFVSVHDKNFRFVRVNKALTDFLGVKEEELIGKHCYEVLHGTEKPWLNCPHVKMFESKETVTEEVDDPNIGCPLLVTASPILDENREIVGSVHIARDITERKKAEEALKEAYDIVNRSPTVAFLWKNTEGWPVEFVSENVKGLFGHSVEDFTSDGISYAETVHPDDLDRVAEEVRRFSEEKGRTDFTHEPYRIVTKEGEVKWVYDITHIRRDQAGSISHYEGIVYDITERKKAEEELNQKVEELERMNRLMVGRELKMIELKEQIKELEGELERR